MNERRLWIEIPTGFTEMQQQAPERALQWRLHVRQMFQAYFAKGYRAVDFVLQREAGFGRYLLARTDNRNRLRQGYGESAEALREGGRLVPTRHPGGIAYPGGQVIVRPPSTCRWMWNTVWPGLRVAIEDGAVARPSKPFSFAIAAARRTIAPTKPVVAGGQVVERGDVPLRARPARASAPAG